MNSEHIINTDMLEQMGNFMYKGHPSLYEKSMGSLKLLEIADIIITDYSSIGYDAIIFKYSYYFYRFSTLEN